MAGEQWDSGTLGEIAEIKTGKLDSNAAVVGGRFPFFTCSPTTLAIDSAAFDCEAAILAGNNADGVFSVKYFHGKFNAYQRTYVITSKDRELVDNKYLYYQLQQLTAMLREYSIGTATRFLTRTILDPLPIPLPPLAEQKAIAAVLGALEDKIELNRQMNATLEAMARALFQSWFVDFDPVSAKLDGRSAAALDPATAALFPKQFEDSPLGRIPRGWAVRPLAELVDVVKGRSYRSEELADSKTALVTLKSFLRGGGYRPDGLKPFTGEYRPNQRVHPGDLVIAFTDVTQAADIVGKPALVQSDECFEILVASLDVGIVRPASRHVSIPFLYCLFLTAEFQGHTYSHATGTTVLHLGSKAVPSFISVVPPVDVAEAFVKQVAPLFSLIGDNTKQCRTLSALRDTLLPKLLSGELDVSEISKAGA